MKAKSGKIIKICALSLGLLLVGGIAVSPITKTYASEPAGQEQNRTKKIIKINYNGDPKYEFIHIWNETKMGETKQDNGKKFYFKGEGSNRYVEAEIEYKKGDKIGFIVAKLVKVKDDGGEEWEKDLTGAENAGGNRYIDALATDMQFSLVENGQTPNTANEYVVRTADKVGNKLQDYVKDLKIWKDDSINWEDAIDKSRINNSNDDDLKNALKNIINYKDSVARDSKDATGFTREGNLKSKDGEVKVIFKDGSSVKVETKLYVFDHLTPGDKDAPENAIKIELKLGEGVWTENDGKKDIEGKKDPVLYRTYKAKPGTDLNVTKLFNTDTLVNLAKGSVKTKEGFTLKLKSENGTDFVVGDNNKVFTAVAEKLPEKPNKEEDKKPDKNPKQPEKEKPSDTKKQKPNYSDVWNGIKLLENKSEKKVKPSEKVLKSYKNLRISREKNVVVVKAAKLLLEIAPERVKDVETNLINLIAKSESLVKQADTILEKLEAKYEF